MLPIRFRLELLAILFIRQPQMSLPLVFNYPMQASLVLSLEILKYNLLLTYRFRFKAYTYVVPL